MNERWPSLPHIAGLRPLARDWLGYEGKVSAVMMLFFPPALATSPHEVLFIRRATGLRSHSGQIGFPGGRCEEGDLSPLATALRETEEEIALPAAHVHVLGMLDPVHALDGHPVFPIVATCDAPRTILKPQESEVAGIFFVPWPLLRSEAAHEVRFTLFGLTRQSPLFPFGEERIWGLTAKMVQNAQLLASEPELHCHPRS